MVRTFLINRSKWNDITRVNEDTGEVLIYSQDTEIGFRFSEYQTTVSDMGYKSIKDFIKRQKQNGKHEVDTKEQEASEIAGLLNLAKYRVQNGKITRDIPKRLTAYGFSLAEATKMTLDAIA